MELFCPWEAPQYLIFSSNAPSLFYYSHFLAIFVTLIFTLILLAKARESFSIKVLLSVFLLFLLWTGIDVLLWASNRPDLVLFYWSLQILLEMLMYAGAFYLAYSFLMKRDLPFKGKSILIALVLPIIVLLPTTFLLPGIDVSYCDAWESPFVILYTYLVEVLLILTILFIAFREINRGTARRKEISFFTAGLIIFLLAFSSGNIIGSITEDWTLAQVGLFGMPIFISLLTYTVVRFKSFNIRLLWAQALVVSLWLLVGSLLLVRSIENIRIITSFTLFVLLIMGIQLVRGVRREIEQREKIEKLAEELQIANNGQTNLMHIINHQIKSYMTKARYIYDALLHDEDYGPVSETAKPIIEKGYKEVTDAVNFVQNFLIASNIESGTFVYDMQPFDFKNIVTKVFEEHKEIAKEKGLNLEIDIEEGDYTMKGDVSQITQVVKNLIDNSIKYTKTGSIKINLNRKDDKIVFVIKDTGVGISDELKPRLFTKGGVGKDSIRININSSGFGLVFVKDVVNAHHGRVWAESEGENKGSTFYMELPINTLK